MSKLQFFEAANDSILFAKYRGLSLGLTPAQVELFELAYLAKVVQAARSVA